MSIIFPNNQVRSLLAYALVNGSMDCSIGWLMIGLFATFDDWTADSQQTRLRT